MSIHFSDSYGPISDDVVETTSVVAARAMARYYGQLEHSQAQTSAEGDDILETSPYISQRQEDGRTVYIIRPFPQDRTKNAAGRRHSSGMGRRPLTLFQSSLRKMNSKETSLRQARSNPQLRSTNHPRPLFTDDRGYYRPTASAEELEHARDPLHFLTLPPRHLQHHILTSSPHSSTPASALNLGSHRSRSCSIPKLSAASIDNLSARGVFPYELSKGDGWNTTDVLGQLLGWSDPILHPKPSLATLHPMERPSSDDSASPLQHVSKVSCSSSVDLGEEATPSDSTPQQKHPTSRAPLPPDLKEELLDQETSHDSPSQSPGPSTPTLTTANSRSLHHFPSNESNTIRFASPVTSKANQSDTVTKTSPPHSPESRHAAAEATGSPVKKHTSPFGQGVKLKSKALKRVKPLQTSESMSAFETSLADLTQEAENDEPRPRFQDPVVFDVLQTLEQHSDIFKYEIASTASRDSFADATPAHGKGSWTGHIRTGSTSSLLSQTSQGSDAKLDAHQITVSAAPSDDPRFVIWGEREPNTFGTSDAHPPLQQGVASAGTRRWSHKASVSHHDLHAAGQHAAHKHFQASPQKVLMAATVERWVAELTSKIDPELLADFFLTYRLFLSPMSLCQLLLTRFDWALAEPYQPQDEAARRIVRVRSFVVIRHWLLNYFVEDFVPDPQLRSTVTTWLNTTAKLPQIKASPSDQRLLKNLKKVVRRLKDQYASIGQALEHSAAQLSEAVYLGDSVVGQVLPQRSLQGPAIHLDEDVDLNFDTYTNATGASHQRGNAAVGHKGTEGMLLPVSPQKERRPSTVYNNQEPFFERAQPAKLVKQQPGSSPVRTSRSTSPVTPVLPLGHSPVSRAVTSTLGQFGRFKRMIQNRANSNANNAAVNASEAYTHDEMIADIFTSADDKQTSRSPSFEQSESPSSTSSYGLGTPSDSSQLSDDSSRTSDEQATHDLGIVVQGDHEEPALRHTFSSQTIKSQTPMPRIRPRSAHTELDQPQWLSEVDHGAFHRGDSSNSRSSVVQLDDVGLSDEESELDEVEPPRTLRRLPAARDLRQAETLRRLVSQASTTTFSSFATNKSPRIFNKPSLDSFRSSSSRHSENSPEGAVPGLITNFVIEGLNDSDDEEPGDVEAALRRLEGQIDDGKQKANAERVERQMAKSKAAASAGPVLETQSESEHESEEMDAGSQSDDSSNQAGLQDRPPSQSTSPTDQTEAHRDIVAQHVYLSEPDPIDRPYSRLSKALSPENGPKSRLSSLRKSMGRKPSIRNFLGRPTHDIQGHWQPQSKLPKISVSASLQTPHRSFVLFCKTELLARQFCLIERDLLSNISWHELIHGPWRRRDVQLDVLDWEQYIKSRARQLVEARDQGRQLDSTEIHAAIARFNLVANWVASEIVMTSQLDERAALVGKFIRLAWKSYRHSNFQTLTQIIHGLQSIYVERLTKTWARVGMWEMRVYRDLKTFTSHARNFRALRNVTDSLAEEWGPPGQTSPVQNREGPGGSRRTSSSAARKSKGSITGCVPFLGLFLRDLAISDELPTFLDATSPTTPASIQNDTNELARIADPKAFADLPTIPSSYQHYPLVNVHKARTISTIVQKVLTFQEMACYFPFEAEPTLFRKCLALQCLPAEGQRTQSFRLEG